MTAKSPEKRPQQRPELLPADTPAASSPGERRRQRSQESGNALQGGYPPVGGLRFGVVESRLCLVSALTDSITRYNLSALLTLPEMQ